MEVAIKMAMRLWDTRAKKGLIKSYQDFSDSDDSEDLVEDKMKKLVVLTQRDCYHGEIADYILPMGAHLALIHCRLVHPQETHLAPWTRLRRAPSTSPNTHGIDPALWRSHCPWWRIEMVACQLMHLKWPYRAL